MCQSRTGSLRSKTGATGRRLRSGRLVRSGVVWRWPYSALARRLDEQERQVCVLPVDSWLSQCVKAEARRFYAHFLAAPARREFLCLQAKVHLRAAVEEGAEVEVYPYPQRASGCLRR